MITLDNNQTCIVIPCYNEEKRLDVNKISSFISQRKNFHLVLVNDGSTDRTIDKLNIIHDFSSDRVHVVDLKQNGGKAGAVRQGVLFALKHLRGCNYIGYLDADLATSLEEFEAMDTFIRNNSYYQLLLGSRMSRIGANIDREGSRKLFSICVKCIIGKITGLPINDTQCGAKVFTREIAADVFATPFHTDWVFDVELFIRIRQILGKNQAIQRLYEYPLMKWTEVGGSKLTMKEIYRTPYMLAKIAWLYNVSEVLANKVSQPLKDQLSSIKLEPSNILSAAA